MFNVTLTMLQYDRSGGLSRWLKTKARNLFIISIIHIHIANLRLDISIAFIF